MSEENLKQAVNLPTVPTVRSPQFRSVYINHATGGISNWDLHFTLGTLVESTPGQAAVEEQIMVMMNYEFAKAMQGTLATAIQAYESKPSTATLLSQAMSLESDRSAKTK